MITAWRIVNPDRIADAFSGEGARLFGGRWNSEGIAVVYTSSTASLAALELLVHLPRDRDLSQFVIFACSFDEELVDNFDREHLPEDWREYPPPETLPQIGDTWLMSLSTAILRVPSVIIDSEFNYLINPAHPDFRKVQIHEPIPFSLDLRLLRR